jgi:hypothetical protein
MVAGLVMSSNSGKNQAKWILALLDDGNHLCRNTKSRQSAICYLLKQMRNWHRVMPATCRLIAGFTRKEYAVVVRG